MIRIKDSLDGDLDGHLVLLIWKGPLEVIWSNPLAQVGSPRDACPRLCPSVFEYLQGGSVHKYFSSCHHNTYYSKAKTLGYNIIVIYIISLACITALREVVKKKASP